MGKETSSSKSQYGWRWILIAPGGVAWLSIGCNPQSISMMLMPFDDDKVVPEYKLFTSNKEEVTLAIVAAFARPEIHVDLQAADSELVEQVSKAMRERCTENKHKLKIVPHMEVRREVMRQQMDGRAFSYEDIGKKLKADYVLDLTLNSFTLDEKDYYPRMFRGRTTIMVNLFKVNAKDGEHKAFSKEFSRTYPGGPSPIDANSITASQFRTAFLNKVAGDISRMFLAYPPDDKHGME